MIITPIPLIDISTNKDAKCKFILLNDGKLLFGMCTYHKDLGAAFLQNENNKEDEAIYVIGAGIVPTDIYTDTEDTKAWGEWVSTGYDIVTPFDLRKEIQRALKKINE